MAATNLKHLKSYLHTGHDAMGNHEQNMASAGSMVSICMPVYNGERFVRQALESLLAQDYNNFELIILDNASNDATQSICLEYAHRDNRVRYYRNSHTIAVLNNFNKVATLANGTYFAWAAHDDLWEPSYISELVGLLEKNSAAVLAFCPFDSVDEDGKINRTFRKIKSLGSENSVALRTHNFIWYSKTQGKAVPIYGLMRIDAMHSILPYLCDDPKWGFDDLLLFRLTLLGKFVYANRILYHNRRLTPEPNTFTAYVWGARQEMHEYYGEYRSIVLASPFSFVFKFTLWLSGVSSEMSWLLKYVIKIGTEQIKTFQSASFKTTTYIFNATKFRLLTLKTKFNRS